MQLRGFFYRASPPRKFKAKSCDRLPVIVEKRMDAAQGVYKRDWILENEAGVVCTFSRQSIKPLRS